MKQGTAVLVHLIAAARPNFMKIAPLYHVLRAEPWCNVQIVHTGQHYDFNMSDSFFRDLGLPDPDIHLGVGSGSHAKQTAGVMTAYEKVCLETPPDWIVVVGDVNSTMASALVGAKLRVPVAHLEAGLRSGDRSMPEEVNRLVTDALADLLWTPSPDADKNLQKEGIPRQKIDRVGNIMIDSFELLAPRIRQLDKAEDLGLEKGAYGVVTLHRPSNVDAREQLGLIVKKLEIVGKSLPLIFPIHPRTRQRLEDFGLLTRLQSDPGVTTMEPIGYTEFMSLVLDCRFVLTDSGGIQEETTYLGIPCLTLRDNTERPITLTHGTNKLVRAESLDREVLNVIAHGKPQRSKIDLWDGATAPRVAASLKKHAYSG